MPSLYRGRKTAERRGRKPVLAAAFRLAAVFSAAVLALGMAPADVRAQEPAAVTSMDVRIHVSEDNTYHVEQRIDIAADPGDDVLFSEWIDLRPQVSFDAGGTTCRRNCPVYVHGVSGNVPVAVETGGGMLELRAQSSPADGQATVEISFDYDVGEDGEPGADMFSFAPAGARRSLPVRGLQFQIDMPAPFDAAAVRVAPAAGVSYTAAGAELQGSYTGELQPDAALDVDILLPAGYYSGVRPLRGPAAICVNTTVLLTCVALVLWMSRRRRRPALMVPVQEEPPAGLTPADLRCILGGVVQGRDIAALLIGWAVQGCVRIYEADTVGGRPVFMFERLSELPAQAQEYEKLLFGEMFKVSDYQTSEDLRDRRRQMLKDTKRRVRARFAQEPSLIAEPRSLMISEICLFLAPVPGALSAAVCGSLMTGTSNMAVLLGLITYFAGLGLGGWNLRRTARRNLITRRGHAAGFLWCVLFTAYLVLVGLAALSFCGLYGLIPPAGVLIMTALAPSCRRRTQLGMYWYGQVLGLHRYLAHRDAKKDPQSSSWDPLLSYAAALDCTWDFESDLNSKALSWYAGTLPVAQLHDALTEALTSRHRPCRPDDSGSH